jgi:hypothetical protein
MLGKRIQHEEAQTEETKCRSLKRREGPRTKEKLEGVSDGSECEALDLEERCL